MSKFAAVLCQDQKSLQMLRSALTHLDTELMHCRSRQEALELVMSGQCSTMIVDFDLAGAEEAIRMASLLPPSQKPALLAIATRAWPGTGAAFQSGASRILYRPLTGEVIREALKSGKKAGRSNRRKSERFELKTLVYLELEHGTLAGISIDIAEHGLAIQATEAVPIETNLPFRCVLPGTEMKLQGHVDVIWASDQGRAGLFFSNLSAPSRKHLKQWLGKRGNHGKHAVRDLLPPADAHVSFAAAKEEELQTEAQ